MRKVKMDQIPYSDAEENAIISDCDETKMKENFSGRYCIL